MNQPKEYIDTRFICGSVCEVERLWSVCKALLGVNRMSVTPIIFEALIFLKVNTEYWDQLMVCEAMCMTRTKRTSERVNAEEEHIPIDA